MRAEHHGEYVYGACGGIEAQCVMFWFIWRVYLMTCF